MQTEDEYWIKILMVDSNIETLTVCKQMINIKKK